MILPDTSSSTAGYIKLGADEYLKDDKTQIYINDGEEEANASDQEENDHLNNSQEDLPPPFDEIIKGDKQQRSLTRKLGVVGVIIGFILLFIIVLRATFFPNLFNYFLNFNSDNYYQAPTQLVKGKNGVVATENVLCSKIGTEILKEGGSAIDASIAGALCIGVVNSFSSGIGGGGFMTIRTEDGKYDFIDFREEAPAHSSFEEYLKQPNRTQFGGTAVGVPGEIKGFELAHKKYGKLAWSRLFEPSIKLARDGFPVGKQLAHYLQTNKQYIYASNAFSDVFVNGGKIAVEGDIVYRRNLANTLEKIAKRGAQAFYKGELANSMINEIRAQGGHMTLKDLASYRAITRRPLTGSFLGNKVVTSPPPTSGAILLSVLNIIEGYKLGLKTHDGMTLELHRLIEAFKFGYAQRTELADPIVPGISKKTLEFIDKATANAIRHNISDSRTFDYTYYHPKFSHKELPGTTHLSVIDSNKMAVGLTTTVNLIFGSKIMDPETGIIFNNQIDDFSIPHTKNGFDLYPSPANFIAPRKRPLSSTVPTIIETISSSGDIELLVVGGSGGSRILTAAVQVILQVLVNGKDIQKAIDHPRLHNQLLPELTYFEPQFCPMIAKSLQEYGHNTSYLTYPNSVIQAAHLSLSGVYSGASDGRKHGKADAY